MYTITDLLSLVGDVYYICVTFPCGILGQVWYSIVSFPGLCQLSYFDCQGFFFCAEWRPKSLPALSFNALIIIVQSLLQQTACLVVNPITVGNFFPL